MGKSLYRVSALKRAVVGLAVGGATCWTSAYSAQATDFFDDMQRIIGPRLLIERGQRINQRIRHLVEGRLRPGNGAVLSGFSSLGTVISPVGAEADSDPMFNAWADVATTVLDSDFTGAEFDGPQRAVGAGLDIAVTDAVIVGVSFDYEHADIRNNIGAFAPGRFETETVSVGPYLGIAVTDNILFDASFVYSWGDNHLSDVGSFAEFDSESWNASASLTAFVPLSDHLTLAPSVGLSYSRSRDEAYVDSVVQAYPSQTIYAGVFNFGATLSYLTEFGNARSIEPSISIEAGYEFDLFGKPALDEGIASNTNDGKVDVTISSGVDVVLSETVSLSVTGSIGGLTRKQYLELSGGGQLSVQF